MIAVGGTTLASSTTGLRGWTETASSLSGSGCSAFEPKPAWQTDTGCSDRSLDDLAAVADPTTPVAYYDASDYPTQPWQEGSGTAAAAAIVAAAYALAGTPAAGSAGAYNFVIDADNGVNPDATQSFTLTVDAGPAITSAATTTFTNQASGSFTVTATGSPIW